MTWFSSSWLRRKAIVIDQANIDADLADYPFAVQLDNSDVLASARGDMRDVLFTSIDGTTKLSHELVKRRFLGTGGWSWFNNPRAIYYSGTYERVYVGTINGAGSLYVGQYDHITGVYAHTLLTATLEVDDHDNPALVVRPSDSKLVALYTKHSADTSLRFKVSTNAEDSTAWGTESTTTFSGNISYAAPVKLADDSNAFYVCCRVVESGSDYRWSYKRTVDFTTWGSEVEFWDAGATQQYLHAVENGTGRIDFFASDGHPDNSAGNTSLYHFYCQWVAGALVWYNSAGTSQTLPIDTTKATLVYDGSSGNDGWNHQIAIDGSGYPRVLFQKRVSTAGVGDNRLMFARWNGSAWTTPVEITALGGYVYSGELSYTGCSCFDGVDIDKVYLGKQVSSIYEIQEWVTTDSGATWAKSRDITTGSSSGQVNMRPFSPKNHNGKLACLWSAGPYTTYLNYELNLFCDPPLAVEAHVKVPSVSGTVNTIIYCYYGNSTAADQESATAAWDSGFMGVYHMEAQPASLSILDSTSNARNGTKKSASEPSIATIGAQKFDGVDDYITLGTALNFAGLTAATVEAVINHDGSGAAGEEHTVFSGWKSTTTEAATMLRIEPNTGGTANRLEGFAVKEANTSVGGDFGITVTPGQINHIAHVFDATDLRGYVNGTVGGTTYATGAAFDAGASGESRIGHTPHDANDGFTNNVYEVRISTVARSPAWLKATNVNLRTPGTFYSFGTEEYYSASVTLAGASLSIASASGGLSISTPLMGDATATASATGGLSLSIPLSGDAIAQSLSTGALTLNVTLSGAAIAEAVAAAGLDVQSTGTVTLSGNAAAESSATGALSLAIPLSGASLVVSSADGSLSQIVPLAGAAASVSLATGGLDVSAALSTLASAALSEASAGATLTLRVNLDGAALVNAIASGVLAGTGELTGTAGYSITGRTRNWRIAS